MSINVALIGLGRIAWLLEKDRLRYSPCTHAGTLRSMNAQYVRPPFHLVGVCDIDAKKTQAFQRWWSKPISCTELNYSKLFSRTDTKLAIIASSLDAHHEIALAAIESGIPAILLEKPMAYNFRQTQSIRDAAMKHGTKVWINFERRYHPAYQKIATLTQSEKLGPLRGISGRVLAGGSNQLAGTLLHDAIHWIDLLLWYVGWPLSTSCRLIPSNRGKRIEESAYIHFHYDSFDAYLESSSTRKYFEFRMMLDYETGRIVSGNDGHNIFQARPSSRYSNFKELKPMSMRFTGKNPWMSLYSNIYRNLRDMRIQRKGGPVSPSKTSNEDANKNDENRELQEAFDDALFGMKIIEDCYDSME